VNAPEILQTQLAEHSQAYPQAVAFLRFMSGQWSASVRETVGLRAEKYGPLFWRTVESAVHDILELYCKYVDCEMAEPNMYAIFQDCMGRFKALPHDRHFEDFDEVCMQFYNQPIYPILEHSFYLGMHGVDRLGRVMELVEIAQSERAADAGEAGRVLCDVAVGPAMIYTTVLEHLNGWRGVAYDISPHCVDYAGDVLALHRISPERAAVNAADARELPDPDESFDLVIATEIIEHLPNPATLLAEVRRVLKPGGHLIASTPINLPWGPHLVVFSDEAEIKSLFAAASFSCQEFVLDELHPGNALTHGLFVKR
jgi:2-polyprenyl-3-methyl-5-hydroxy-6-metoxy-1,4-benzoquinol methylase